MRGTVWISGKLAVAEICEICGALVLDAELHRRWHANEAETASPPGATTSRRVCGDF